MVIALARPRAASAVVTNSNLGVGIVLILDLTGSMAFVDVPPANAPRASSFATETLVDSNGHMFYPTRLEVARKVINNYI